ncbi:MAG TPA: hypothetical protein VML00_02855, partial [Bacteroidota bacterium]|nr:hypothetical protein [Bacteroidota bacterium]
MKQMILVGALLAVAAAHAPAQQSYDVIPGGFVSGDVRIRILSPTLARCEYSPAARFVDSLTAVVVNRRWTSPHVTLQTDGEWLALRADGITVRYRPGPGPLTHGNLRIDWTAGGMDGAWAPGDSDRANLGGISSSLDGARRGRLPKQLPGILSRAGYFLLDDSRTPVWDGKAQWIAVRGDSG